MFYNLQEFWSTISGDENVSVDRCVITHWACRYIYVHTATKAQRCPSPLLSALHLFNTPCLHTCSLSNTYFLVLQALLPWWSLRFPLQRSPAMCNSLLLCTNWKNQVTEEGMTALCFKTEQQGGFSKLLFYCISQHLRESWFISATLHINERKLFDAVGLFNHFCR